MKFLFLLLLFFAASLACDLLMAQFVCFGLSEYRIQSGLIGPFFLGLTLEGFIGMAMAVGGGSKK